MTDQRTAAPLQDSFLGISLGPAYERVRAQQFDTKEERHKRYLAQYAAEQEAAQKEQEQSSTPSVDQIKKALAQADPKELAQLGAFMEKLDEQNYFTEGRGAEEDLEETASLDELEEMDE